MRPGEPVLFRSVYRERVRFAFSHRLVADDGGRLALYLAPGTHGVMGGDPDGRYLERWARGDDPHPHVWNTHHVLWLVRPEETHMLGDSSEAAAVRAEGERVIAERPWPTGWEEWRPDPAWTPPPLPAGWQRT